MAPANTIAKCRGLGGLWGPLICWYVLAVIEEERESEIKVMPMFSQMASVQKKATLNHMAAASTKINVRKPLFSLHQHLEKFRASASKQEILKSAF